MEVKNFLKNAGISKKIAFWAVVFAVLVLLFQILITRDFFGEYQENKKKTELLAKVDEIESAYFGLSPFWLRRYGIGLLSEEESSSDNDKDGLTLREEYENLTDPRDPDTDKDGWPDGEEVENGYNPLGGGRLDRNKDGLPDFWETENGFSLEIKNASNDPDGDGLLNKDEYAHGTDPNKADTDGDGYDDLDELSHGYDPLVPGSARLSFEIMIKKIGISAPIVLSADASEAALLADLEKGTILYPKMAIPGQLGNSVINGHSSNYSWAKGEYNYIFKDLNSLEEGDGIEIKMTQSDGKTFSYLYQVTDKKIVQPDEAEIFAPVAEKRLTLVTCWPLNTNLRRLMVKAEAIEK